MAYAELLLFLGCPHDNVDRDQYRGSSFYAAPARSGGGVIREKGSALNTYRLDPCSGILTGAPALRQGFNQAGIALRQGFNQVGIAMECQQGHQGCRQGRTPSRLG